MYGYGFGLARYVEQLVKQLQKTDKENEYVLFLRKDNFDGVNLTASNFKKVLADIPWYSWREQWQFKKLIKKEKVDLRQAAYILAVQRVAQAVRVRGIFP